jgi:hypothetical protein
VCGPAGVHGRRKVNHSLAEEDQTAPKAVRSYVTTAYMMPDQKPHGIGYWKEKQIEAVHRDGFVGRLASLYVGLKMTFQFHTYNGTKTNWFMHEYIPTEYISTESFGCELFLQVRFVHILAPESLLCFVLL